MQVLGVANFPKSGLWWRTDFGSRTFQPTSKSEFFSCFYFLFLKDQKQFSRETKMLLVFFPFPNFYFTVTSKQFGSFILCHFVYGYGFQFQLSLINNLNNSFTQWRITDCWWKMKMQNIWATNKRKRHKITPSIFSWYQNSSLINVFYIVT